MNQALKIYYKNSRRLSAQIKRSNVGGGGSPRIGNSSVSGSDLTPNMIYGSDKKRRKSLAKQAAQQRNEKYRLILSGGSHTKDKGSRVLATMKNKKLLSAVE